MSNPLIFATFLAPTCYKTYQYIIEYVERYIKVPAFLLNGETLEDFAAAYVDVGFISPLAYVQLLNQQPCPIELLAAPIPSGASDQETPPVYSAVVVRSDSTLTSLPELAESVWAHYPGRSHIEDHAPSKQATIQFRKSIEAPTAAKALRLILAGEADATAIDIRSLSIAIHNSPRIAAGLRILGVTSTPGSSTAPVAVVATHIPLPVRLKLQVALASLHRDPFFAQRLQEEAIARFLPLTNLHYQRTPAISDHCTSAPVQQSPLYNATAYSRADSWTASVPK